MSSSDPKDKIDHEGMNDLEDKNNLEDGDESKDKIDSQEADHQKDGSNPKDNDEFKGNDDPKEDENSEHEDSDDEDSDVDLEDLLSIDPLLTNSSSPTKKDSTPKTPPTPSPTESRHAKNRPKDLYQLHAAPRLDGTWTYVKEGAILLPSQIASAEALAEHDWPHSSRPSLAEIEAAGWTHVKSKSKSEKEGKDTAYCFHCGVKKSNWTPVDSPYREHKRCLAAKNKSKSLADITQCAYLDLFNADGTRRLPGSYLDSPTGSASSGKSSEDGHGRLSSKVGEEFFEKHASDELVEYLHKLPRTTAEEKESSRILIGAFVELKKLEAKNQDIWMGRDADWWWWFLVANFIAVCIHFLVWDLTNNPFWEFFV